MTRKEIMSQVNESNLSDEVKAQIESNLLYSAEDFKYDHSLDNITEAISPTGDAPTLEKSFDVLQADCEAMHPEKCSDIGINMKASEMHEMFADLSIDAKYAIIVKGIMG